MRGLEDQWLSLVEQSLQASEQRRVWGQEAWEDSGPRRPLACGQLYSWAGGQKPSGAA